MRNRGTADLQRTDHLRKRAPGVHFKIGLLALEDLRIDLEPIRIGQGVEQSRQLSVGVLHSSIIIEMSRYVNTLVTHLLRVRQVNLKSSVRHHDWNCGAKGQARQKSLRLRGGLGRPKHRARMRSLKRTRTLTPPSPATECGRGEKPLP